MNQEGTGPAFDNFCAMQIHTDDSLSTPVSIPGLTSNNAVLNALPACSPTGLVSFCYGNTNTANATIARWQAADVPAFTVDTLALDPTYSDGGVSLAAGAGTNYFLYACLDNANVTVVWRYRTSVGLGAWGVDNTLFTFDNSGVEWIGNNAFNFISAFLAVAGKLAITMPYNANGDVALMGQGYFEPGAAPPVPVALFSPQIAQALIIPFPVGNPCCSPKQVGCVECSKDGNLYAISKGPFGKVK